MHLRDYEDEIAGAVDEAVRLARETKSRLLISHLRPNNRASGAYSDIMKTIEEADDVFFDIAMSSSVLRELYTLLPEWAQNGGFTIMQENIKDPWFQKRMLKELPALNPATTLVVQAPNHDFLVGMTLESFANRIGVPPAEALLQLMQATKLYATLQIEDSRPEEMKPYLAHPRLIVGSNAAAMPKFFKPATSTHHDALRSFLKYPSLIDAPVEQAVHAMTGRPAGFFGLKERGLIKEGYFADIVLVRNQKVEWALVNGLVAIREGHMETGAASGKVLRCSGIS
jgi:N-acyl-D-aspartate/D-glutamate deacylase